jgi:hypothetical protein
MQEYRNQSPADIRYGDKVVDALGREFWAHSDATVLGGDYEVMGALVSSPDDYRYFTLDKDSLVTISFVLEQEYFTLDDQA